MEIEFRDYQQTDRHLISSWIKEAVASQKDLEDAFMKHFSDVIANGKLIIAVHKDIPVGFSGGKTIDNNNSLVSLLFVTPSYRGNYLGRELLCLLEDFYSAQGCSLMSATQPLSQMESGFLGGMGYKNREESQSDQLSKPLRTDNIV